jgi:hypothetical protein
MKALIKNRNDYNFIDTIFTNENRNKTLVFIDIILLAQARFGFSEIYETIKYGGLTIIYDDDMEIIYPIK